MKINNRKSTRVFASLATMILISQLSVQYSTAATKNAYCPGAMPMHMPDMGEHPHALGTGVKSEYAGYKLNITNGKLIAGAENTIKYNITDSKKKVVTKYVLDIGKLNHTIIFSSDYKTYIHKHAEVDKKGNFTMSVNLPKSGSYHMIVDFAVPFAGDKVNKVAHLVLGQDIVVGSKSNFVKLAAPTCTVNTKGYKIALDKTTLPLEHDSLMLTLTKNGQPVLLGKYLGTVAHLVIIKESDRSYAHMHPMNPDGSMGEMYSDTVDVTKVDTTKYTDKNGSKNDIKAFNPKEFNPTPGMLHFMTEPPGAGRYTAFLQFVDGGKVQTVSFIIDAK